MTAEADEPRKRRKYTTAERLAILKTADKVGPVEAARHHGVPQTTVSNWLHRDATKVAKEVGERADESKPMRTRRAATSAIAKAAVGSTVEPTVTKAATKAVATKAVATKAVAAKTATPTTMLPKPGTPLPDSLVKRVARSYTPSEKAQALEHAAPHGVSAASDKFEISRFSIYDWQRKLKKAAAGEGPSPASGPSRQTIEEQRDQEILGEWRKHPGLGPSQIRNQLRRRGVKVSVTTARVSVRSRAGQLYRVLHQSTQSTSDIPR
jgi:transposase-like protein